MPSDTSRKKGCSRLPILMYHAVGDPSHGYPHPGNFVSEKNFAGQLEWLSANKYRSISVKEWLGYRAGKVDLPERCVGITFDDGYHSVYEKAWPLLRQHGFGATVFIVTSAIGLTNYWENDDAPIPLMTEAQIREMNVAGIVFGSHTRTHLGLRNVTRETALQELRNSRTKLESLVGPVSDFAYPYSKAGKLAAAYVREAGYSSAVRGGGKVNSLRSNPFLLSRIKVEPDWTVRQFANAFRPRWAEFLRDRLPI